VSAGSWDSIHVIEVTLDPTRASRWRRWC
jgi:hypothetical protein